MSSIRPSKVRNVFSAPFTDKDTWWPVSCTTQAGDHGYISCSTKYIAVPITGGGGPVAIFHMDKPGRYTKPNTLVGHTRPVTDSSWNPFNASILATGSADATIKIWQMPEEETFRLTKPLTTLEAHAKRILFTEFHPAANNVLAAADFAKDLMVWDITRGDEPLIQFDGEDWGLVTDLQWNYDGSRLGTSSKDKNVRIFDPRNMDSTMMISEPHNGSKAIKIVFADKIEKVITFGSSKQSRREWKVWDPRNPSKHLSKGKIDQGSGTFLPSFDVGTNLIFLPGKGDSTVRTFEVIPEAPWVQVCNDFRLSGNSPKGFCVAPKRSCDVMSCEVRRLLRLTTKNVEPLKMTIPRRSKSFQPALYPDDFAGVPALDADSWMAGENKAPVLASMDPKKAGESKSAGATFTKSKSRAELEAELKATQAHARLLKAEIESMQKQLADAA